MLSQQAHSPTPHKHTIGHWKWWYGSSSQACMKLQGTKITIPKFEKEPTIFECQALRWRRTKKKKKEGTSWSSACTAVALSLPVHWTCIGCQRAFKFVKMCIISGHAQPRTGYRAWKYNGQTRSIPVHKVCGQPHGEDHTHTAGMREVHVVLTLKPGVKVWVPVRCN